LYELALNQECVCSVATKLLNMDVARKAIVGQQETSSFIHFCVTMFRTGRSRAVAGSGHIARMTSMTSQILKGESLGQLSITWKTDEMEG
jgi:hypothetical protein